MAVKVHLNEREIHSLTPKVDVYPHEDDEYWTDGDGKKLEVVVHDGTVATYPPGSWSKVKGKRAQPGIA
jgi:hypothetical protein